METINIIGQTAYCYDIAGELFKEIPLSDFQNIDTSLLAGTENFSLNVTSPVKRVVLFYKVAPELQPTDFNEILYVDMSTSQQNMFDDFVSQAMAL